MKSFLVFLVIAGGLIFLGYFIKSGKKINTPKLGSVGSLKGIPLVPVLWIIFAILGFFWFLPEVAPQFWKSFRNSGWFMPFLILSTILAFLAFVKYQPAARILLIAIIVLVIWKFGGCSSNASAGETGRKNVEVVIEAWAPGGQPKKVYSGELPTTYTPGYNYYRITPVTGVTIGVSSPTWTTGEIMLTGGTSGQVSFPEVPIGNSIVIKKK